MGHRTVAAWVDLPTWAAPCTTIQATAVAIPIMATATVREIHQITHTHKEALHHPLSIVIIHLLQDLLVLPVAILQVALWILMVQDPMIIRPSHHLHTIPETPTLVVHLKATGDLVQVVIHHLNSMEGMVVGPVLIHHHKAAVLKISTGIHVGDEQNGMKIQSKLMDGLIDFYS